MEIPLLSQDEFFRHLNLRSVHATSAKYHYRQALKERLRASSKNQSLALTPKKEHAEVASIEIKSPVLSPVKWLTPKTQTRMFGRPKIRKEKRVLDFDNNLKVIKEENENHDRKLLESLLSNCHVLRHPGIRREVESKIYCGKAMKTFDVKDEFWEPPTSTSIQIRKSYLKTDTIRPKAEVTRRGRSKPRVPSRQPKVHVIHIRPQPSISDESSRTKREQKISAALALYHFYKPKSEDGQILSLKEFTKVFAKKSRYFRKTFLKFASHSMNLVFAGT